MDEVAQGYRLACRTAAADGMRVALLREPDGGGRILEFGSGTFERIAPAVRESMAREAFGISDEGEILGVALDIGTTTLAASLLDLRNGALLCSASCANPQSAHGGDVISRISYAVEASSGLEILQREVVDATNALIERLAAKACLGTDRILHVVAAGNTTMEHCFRGVSPEPIGRAPFAPPFRRADRVSAGALGLKANPLAFVDLISNIAGHVGGDLVSGIYYSKMLEGDEISLLIDTGTNNEMALGNRHFLVVCSAAAGPALEGACIRDGMRATCGAIEHVAFEDGLLHCSVIGDCAPGGICGSGLVDLIAGMLRVGVLSSTGRIAAAEAVPGSLYAGHLAKAEGGREFRVAPRDGGFIAVTQKDVRETQLAKGAIATGLEMLLDRAGLRTTSIDRVLLAGAFGSYMDLENAIALGILPDLPREGIIPLGNAAGLGCAKALLHGDAFDIAEEIAAKAEHLELATSPAFQEKFLKNLEFKTCLS